MSVCKVVCNLLRAETCGVELSRVLQPHCNIHIVKYAGTDGYYTLMIQLDIELVAVGAVRPRERVVADFIKSGAVSLNLFDPHRIEGVTLDLADILIESQLKLRFCLAGVIDKRRAAVSEYSG